MLVRKDTEPFLVNAPRLLSDEPQSNSDVIVACTLLLPAGVLAAAFYVSGSILGAMLVAGTAFAVSCFITPQVGVYGYFALQALDAAFATGKEDVFTPAKALGPFVLLTWLGWAGRRKTEIYVSKSFIWWMIAFGAFGMLTSAFATVPLAALRYGAQVVVQALIAAVTIDFLCTRRYVGRAMLWTVVGGVIASGYLLITGGGTHHYSRATLGEFANPNTTAMGISIALGAIPAAWTLTRTKLYYLFYLAAAPLLLAAMFKTGSRSALLAVVTASSVGIIFARGGNVVKRALFAVFCLAVTAGIFFAVLQSKLLDKTAQERMEAFVYDTGSVSKDSRMDIWKVSLQSYLSNPLFGCGYGNNMFAVGESHGLHIDIHSTYLGALVDGGPIAMAILLYALWKLFRIVRGARTSVGGIPAMIMYVLLIMSGLTHTIHFTKWWWVPATICLVLAESIERERRSVEAYTASGNQRLGHS